MENHNTTDNNISTTNERIVLFQNYMDWEGAAGVNYRHKIEEIEKKEKKSEESISSNDISSHQIRGLYNTKNDVKVAKMINLLQEFEGMSIKVAAAKVILPYSTVKRRVNQWNEACNNGEDVFPGSSKKTGLNITSRAVNEHMRKKCHLTYKRTIRQLVACDDDTTVLQRYEAVSAWKALEINFFSEGEHALIHVDCTVKVQFDIKNKTGVLHQKGTHSHGKFIPLHFTMETLEKPARPISNIDLNLRNMGTIKRLQRNYLVKNDKLQSSQPALESVHTELADLTKEFPGYLQSADITPGNMCITFSAPGIAAKADFKKHPMLTDVTYDCFTKGYYLCSTNIYFEELDKFAVIFQGVLDGLSMIHFKSYFLTLFKTFNVVFGDMEKIIDMNFSGLLDLDMWRYWIEEDEL
ncbi:hypothetical protein BDA99DRAFT_557152 [Phascolomyces articulosus]|uniref:Homeodomain-like DNA binding domain-containing transcription factor n=1 Tax=Phascolomyces articulosus TaxID=60185 RepID=A0AAD5KIY2_9FUNG|nr:hypothetical protein BDA99DRAFT_557152 [Phascolomyces articulosus]